MFRHRAKYGKGGKQENQMERNEMKHVKCMTDTPTLRPFDPLTYRPTPSTVKYANVAGQRYFASAWFGLAWLGNLLQHIANMPSLLIGLLALPTAKSRCLPVCLCVCVCVFDLIRVRAAR